MQTESASHVLLIAKANDGKLGLHLKKRENEFANNRRD
jgi:hypothetical protein